MRQETLSNLKKATIQHERVQDFKIDNAHFDIKGNLIEIHGQVNVDGEWSKCKWDHFGFGSTKASITTERKKIIISSLQKLESKGRQFDHGKTSKQIDKLKAELESGYMSIPVNLIIVEPFSQES